MATYTVDHSCGHQEDHYVTGPKQSQQAERLKVRICGDCWKQQTAGDQVARTKAAHVAAELAATEGLPPLTGSQKQIAWAERIRRGTILAARQSAPAGTPGDLLDRAMEVYRGIISRPTKAAWWIDHRASVGDAIPLGDLVELATDADRARLAEIRKEGTAPDV